jgi:hypothetical protein
MGKRRLPCRGRTACSTDRIRRLGEALPDSLRDTATAEAVQAIVDLDLDRSARRDRATAWLRTRLIRNEVGNFQPALLGNENSPICLTHEPGRRITMVPTSR